VSEQLFVIPGLELVEPDQTRNEIMAICRPYGAAAMLERGDGNKYDLIVTRPVPLDLGAEIAQQVGVRGLLHYWPGPVSELRLIIRDQSFERVLRAVHESVNPKLANVLDFDPKVVNCESGHVEVTLAGQQDAARHDTLIFYLMRYGILSPSADIDRG
jgi:hypothetical protein